MKWTALNEYLISHDGTLLEKTNMTQQAEGIGNREFVLEHNVDDIIVNTHFPLLLVEHSKLLMSDIMVLRRRRYCLPCY